MTTTKKNTNKTTKKQSTKKVTKNKTTKQSNKNIIIEQTANKYGKTIISGILVIVLVIAAYIGCELKPGSDTPDPSKPYVATEDEKKFKNEYESLNGEIRQSNNQVHYELTINEDNNIEYITLDKANEIIENGSGVIYFGYAASPSCRIAVEQLIAASSATSIEKIYYVNVRPEDDTNKDIRDIYTLNEKNKTKKVKDADQSYYDLLTKLNNNLNDYVLVSDNGTKVSTGEKRLESPTVIAVKDGEILDIHIGTVENKKEDKNGIAEELTKNEKVDLFNAYTILISKYTGESCDLEKAC